MRNGHQNMTDTVHLAIDYQKIWLSHLRDGRRVGFTAAAREFADDLRGFGAPTIWVAYDTEPCGFEYINDDFRHLPLRREAWITRFGLGAVYPLRDEFIFLKCAQDAFNRATPFNPLSYFLDKNGYKNVILSGLSTCACILKTALGGLREGYNVTIAYDQLADDKHESRHSVDKRWHLDQLITLFSPEQLNKIQMTIKKGCIEHLAKRAARPDQRQEQPLVANLAF